MKKYLFKTSVLFILSYRGKKSIYTKKLFLSFLFFFILGSGQQIDAKWNSPTVLKKLQEISGMHLLDPSFFYSKNTELINELDLGLFSKRFLLSSYINEKKLNEDRFVIKHLAKNETKPQFIENKNQEKLSDTSIDTEKETLQDTLQYDSSSTRIMTIAPQNNLLMIIHLIVLVILLLFLLAHAKIKEQ